MSKLTVIEDKNADTELNYFVFETHVRKLIRDLIEPTTQKATEDRENVNEVKRIMNNVSKRVYELEYIIYKGSERNTIFDDIYNKMNQMVVETNLLNEKLKEESFKFMKRHEIMDDQLKAIEITQKTVGDQIRNFQNDIDKFYETLHETKKDLTEIIYDNKQRADADVSSINQIIIRIQTTMKINQHEFEAASGKITKLEKDKDRHKDRLEQLGKDIFELQEVKLDKQQFNMDTKKIEEQFSQIDYSLGDLNNNILGTDNYIEKYLPFKSLQLMVESMSQILDKKQVKRLTDFEQKKYKELHQGILGDDGHPNNAEKASYLKFLNSAEKGSNINHTTTNLARRESTLIRHNEELYSRGAAGQHSNPSQFQKMQSSQSIVQQNFTTGNQIKQTTIQFNSNTKLNILVENGQSQGDSKNSIESKDEQINSDLNGKQISVIEFDNERVQRIKPTGLNRNQQIHALASQDTYLSLKSPSNEHNLQQISPREGSVALRQNTSQNQIGMSLIGMNDLDPILQNKIRTYDEDFIELKQELESVKKLILDVKGLNRADIDKEFKRVRDELKQASKEILSYCEAFQTEFENEQDFRKKDKINWQLEIDNLNKEVQRINSYCVEKLFKPLNNLQDMAVLPVKNYELSTGLNTPAQQSDYIGIHNIGSARRQDVAKTAYQQHRKLLSSSQVSMTAKGSKQTNSLYQLRAETPQLFQVGAQTQSTFIKRKQSKAPFTNYHSNQSSSSNLFTNPNGSVIAGSTFASSNNQKQIQFDEMPLQYRKKLFRRDQLIMVRGYLLQQAWNMYSQSITDQNVKANNVQLTSQLFKQALKELQIDPMKAGQNRVSNKQSMNRLKDINSQYETQNHQKSVSQTGYSLGQPTNQNGNSGMAIFGLNPTNHQNRPHNDNFSPLQTPAYQDQQVQQNFANDAQKLNQNSLIAQ
ncbi:UNKNOWN [Stylonychia lemnae]|uniref:Uncharacterized protein n=1 Tax=Stylonychia lemnae TaxID=5949 RepID=A0A078ALM3_STYLE|nr:UNKNOWN [Stylonychia lemnae]|eukprot:CDW81758.1 UNKNOWN [Stylonychia lemnae]